MSNTKNYSGKHLARVGAKRQDVLLVTDLKAAPLVVGVDSVGGTIHKSKADHPLWDQRAVDAMTKSHPSHVLLEAMARSIARLGVQKPIRARRDGQTILTADGRRRNLAWRLSLKICKEEGWEPKPLPVWMITDTDVAILARSRTANAHSLEDTPTARAEDIQRMIDGGLGWDEIADVYGETVGGAKKLHKLLDCSTKVQRAVNDGKISVSAATRLAKLSREDQDSELAILLAGGEPAEAPAAAPEPGAWRCHAKPNGKTCGHLNVVTSRTCAECGRPKTASDARAKDAAAKPAKPVRATVKATEDRLREREGKLVVRPPKERIERAIEMVKVQALATGEGVLHPVEFLQKLEVELLSGSKPTPAEHDDDCWRKPGHHPCAITKIEAMLAGDDTGHMVER